MRVRMVLCFVSARPVSRLRLSGNIWAAAVDGVRTTRCIYARIGSSGIEIWACRGRARLVGRAAVRVRLVGRRRSGLRVWVSVRLLVVIWRSRLVGRLLRMQQWNHGWRRRELARGVIARARVMAEAVYQGYTMRRRWS